LGELDGALFGISSGPSVSAVLREELIPPPDAPQGTFDASPWIYLTHSETRLVHDRETLVQRIADEVVDPLAGLEDVFARTTTVTRFFSTSDAEEMTKDPIFAFNPDLPEVASQHVLTVDLGTHRNCTQFGRANYPDGRRVALDGDDLSRGTIGPIPGEPALLFAEVLDEEGAPMRFDPLQAVEVDRALDNAIVGIPSLPSGFELTQPPPPAKHKDVDTGGCDASVPGAYILFPLLVLAWLRRRRAA
jgi:uncharacterized protein (TIGR03382 family)